MIEPRCLLCGEAFSPDKMLDGSMLLGEIVEILEPGQIGYFGRYRGMLMPYGACTIIPPKHVGISKRIEWMADFVLAQMANFRNYGATEIIFHIDWKGAQGNMELTASELGKLAALQIPVTITYIREFDT